MVDTSFLQPTLSLLAAAQAAVGARTTRKQPGRHALVEPDGTDVGGRLHWRPWRVLLRARVQLRIIRILRPGWSWGLTSEFTSCFRSSTELVNTLADLGRQ